MPKRDKHYEREVTGRAFTLHTRAFGVDHLKMNRWIRAHHDIITDLFLVYPHGQQMDERQAASAIGRGDYNPDRARLNGGPAAYSREKRVHMKYLGLYRGDGVTTNRMRRYIQALDQGNTGIELLREYSLKIKLECPQVRTYLYEKGHSQASYAHYRIRPIVMFLYAIKQGQELHTTVNTDDVVLSVLRFYPPYETQSIDEIFLKKKIEEYFQRKVSEGIDYYREFRQLYELVSVESKEKLPNPDIDPLLFKQKCRNSANNAWCLIIFTKRLGLIDTDIIRAPLPHWSSTQQEYMKRGITYPTEYDEITLTSIGKEVLASSLQLAPVWYKDIQKVFGKDLVGEALNMISILAHDGKISKDSMSSDIITGLSTLGVELKLKGNFYHAIRKPLYELEYDIPPAKIRRR